MILPTIRLRSRLSEESAFQIEVHLHETFKRLSKFLSTPDFSLLRRA